MATKRLGLIVNPVAGMGGRVGLGGSDGPDVLRRARELGAQPEAPARARTALGALGALAGLEVLVYPGEMGEAEARAEGFEPTVIGSFDGGERETTPDDTREAARLMAAAGVDLILFAGGDGTARDVYAAVGDGPVCLGIPAGVKIHSAVYATNPRSGGELAGLYLQDRVRRTKLAEVMDIDEEAFRVGRVQAALHGYLRVPNDASRVQSMKSARAQSEEEAFRQIAYRIVDDMLPGITYILGPGSTVKGVKDALGIDGTLLGVDVVRDRRLVVKGATEDDLLRVLGPDDSACGARIVVTAIGGQGHILGRGNQQISPAVLRRTGARSVIVVATRDKLLALQGRPLLVDTGDPDLDTELFGYVRVATGYNEDVVVRVGAGAEAHPGGTL
jgi:predicted polyphosphate/ATP-dependent NAD kinase